MNSWLMAGSGIRSFLVTVFSLSMSQDTGKTKKARTTGCAAPGLLISSVSTVLNASL